MYFTDIIDLLAIVFAAISYPTKNDKAEVNGFVDYIAGLNIEYLNNEKLEAVKKKILEISVRLRFSCALYKLFFKIKSPKIIIVEDGHYGAKSHIIHIARKLGIKTAEYQHGYVGLAHPAYNFHKNIASNVESFLPEYLLTHGKYWSEIVRTPAKKIEIGFPNLTEKINKYDIGSKKSQKANFVYFRRNRAR